jgi:hypothetical protein
MLGGIFCHLAFATNLSLGTSPKYTDQVRDGQDRFQKFSKIFSAIFNSYATSYAYAGTEKQSTRILQS